MNNLSWLLYIADVVQSISLFFGVIFAVGTVLFAIASFIYALWATDQYPELPWLIPNFNRYLIALILTGIIWCVMPAKQTVYMIAASEMGEKVAKTAEAQEVFDLLKGKVREALGSTTKKDSK